MLTVQSKNYEYMLGHMYGGAVMLLLILIQLKLVEVIQVKKLPVAAPKNLPWQNPNYLWQNLPLMCY